MSVGLHGHNGLSVEACIHIYKVYVMPRLLYGLEAVTLSVGQVTDLNSFHTRTLRMVQSLPQRCAKSAIYLLSGVLPVEAYYDYSLLSMLGRLIRSGNRPLACLAVRQLARCPYNSNSWFVKTTKVLIKYDLPDLVELLENTPSEVSWKTQIRKAVYGHWEQKLKEEAAMKSTLGALNKSLMTTGKLHPVWTTTMPCTHDVKRSAVKAKLLTSTYLFQATRAKFRQHNVTALCPLCEAEDEDRTHFLLSCSKLEEPRTRYLPMLLSMAERVFGNLFDDAQNQDLISQLIVDCTVLADDHVMSHFSLELDDIEVMSRRLVYALHCRRAEIIAVRCLKTKKSK